MADETAEKHRILFVCEEAEDADDVKAALEQLECELYCRHTRRRAFQLLAVTKIDLVIAGLKLADHSGLAFCKEVRSDSGVSSTPLVLVGEDDEGGSHCVKALELGADDFITMPFVQAVFLARIQRLLKKKAKSGSASSLSVQVSSGELPGIITFLEAEVKTGRLAVRSGENTVVIYLKEGRLANATGPNCEGPDAITEALSWATSHVIFHEEELDPEDVKFSLEPTGTIMNCVFEVDEFREAQRRLPPPDVMFRPGKKALPHDLPAPQRVLHHMAIEGHSFEHILRDQKFSERQATMWLHELIDKEHLAVGESPFAHYPDTAAAFFSQFNSQFLEHRLLDVKDALTEIEFPISPPTGRVGFHPADWVSPEPKLLLLGDNAEHLEMFYESVEAISMTRMKAKPTSRGTQGGVRITRVAFAEKTAIDVVRLPLPLNKGVKNSLDEVLEEAFAVLVMVSKQSRKSLATISLAVRQLRQRYKGIYYHIVPQVKTKYGTYIFRMDCGRCGYTLAVDMAQVGGTGECPICNTRLTIPDSMDHLAESLHLPDDVPVVLVQPASAKHCRDLLLFAIDSALNACQLSAKGKKARKHSTQILTQSEVLERTARHGRPPPATTLKQASEAGDAATGEPEPADFLAQQRHLVEALVEEALERTKGGGTGELNSGDEDELDIDDLIRRLRESS